MFKRLRLPNPASLAKGVAYQGAGVLILSVAQKYIPNIWARWAIYIVSGGIGIWYPITRAILTSTGLDKTIEEI